MVFQFKQFSIQQEQSAMKIGTDGVLLGAWASVQHQPENILDIGAGTGVIALMLAQRSSATLIDAVEIDDRAYEECVQNFENSPWNDRVFCYHASLEMFSEEPENTYDLIVSNPPFFESPKTEEKPSSRDKARFYNNLPFQDLIKNTAQLLDKNGIFCTIIPTNQLEKFTQLALQQQLFLQKQVVIRGHKNSAEKRVLLQFGFLQQPLAKTQLIIEKSRHKYTEAYKNLVKDFYLKI